MSRLISLAVFLLLVVIASAVGGQFVGGDWYDGLIKPSWTPSAVLMSSAWAVLYVLMAVSAWMVWDARKGGARTALGWWGLQLILSVGWSWTLFGLNRLGWALALISLWILVVLVVIRVFRPINNKPANLMMPLAAWLVFVWVLNFFLWHLNGGGLGSFF